MINKFEVPKLKAYRQRKTFHSSNNLAMTEDIKGNWVRRSDAENLAGMLQQANKRIAELEAGRLAVKLPPHKFSECVNELLEGAIAYAGTQQLRAQLSTRLSNFVKPDHPAGITVQGDE